MKHYVEVLIYSVILAALIVFCLAVWNDTHASDNWWEVYYVNGYENGYIENYTELAGDYIPLDSISPVIKPDIKPLECNLQRETPDSAYMGSAMSANGLEFHFYDTNGDGIRDAILSIPQNDENRYPLFYSFDNTYNGEPDITWVDKLRDGTCGDVEVYWYRGQKKPESNRHENKPVDCVTEDCDKLKEGEV